MFRFQVLIRGISAKNGLCGGRWVDVEAGKSLPKALKKCLQDNGYTPPETSKVSREVFVPPKGGSPYLPPSLGKWLHEHGMPHPQSGDMPLLSVDLLDDVPLFGQIFGNNIGDLLC